MPLSVLACPSNDIPRPTMQEESKLRLLSTVFKTVFDFCGWFKHYTWTDLKLINFYVSL